MSSFALSHCIVLLLPPPLQLLLPPAGALAPEQEAAANDLLQKTVELMSKEFAAGCPYRELAEGLGQRLGRLGVSGSSEAGAALLVAFSGSLVDTMGKAGEAGVGMRRYCCQLLLLRVCCDACCKYVQAQYEVLCIPLSDSPCGCLLCR